MGYSIVLTLPLFIVTPSCETMLDSSARLTSILCSIEKGEHWWLSIIYSARD